MHNLFLRLSALSFMAMLSLIVACGGGGGTSNESVQQGIIIDSEIINIGYRTDTIEGVTNSLGQFDYLAGENVVFYIGDLEFPSVQAKGIVTVLDLANSQDLADSRVINIARLLQTLDKDGNTENGITITSAAISAATQLNFNLAIEEFESASAVTNFIANAGQDTAVLQLVSVSDAIFHLESQLIDNDVITITSTASYVLNGEQVTVDVQPDEEIAEISGIGMDQLSPSRLHLFLKNLTTTPREVVQIFTSFNCKADFDNAFENNELVLTQENGLIVDTVMDYQSGLEFFDYSTLVVTINKSPGGGYDVATTGVATGLSSEMELTDIRAEYLPFRPEVNGDGVCQ